MKRGTTGNILATPAWHSWRPWATRDPGVVSGVVTQRFSVGGTALTLGSGNHWSSEVGWSGSGGGPSYNVPTLLSAGRGDPDKSRGADPDVAYDATPFDRSRGVRLGQIQRFNLGWIEVGGTSGAVRNGRPFWRSPTRPARPCQPALDSASPREVKTFLYKSPADFHDITSGTSTGTPNYSAGPGFDYVTGLGPPMASLVVGSLTAPRLPRMTRWPCRQSHARPPGCHSASPLPP